MKMWITFVVMHNLYYGQSSSRFLYYRKPKWPVIFSNEVITLLFFSRIATKK